MGLKPTLTPEQQAVAAERRAAREAKRLALAAGVEQPVEEVEDPRARVLKREWIPARAAPGAAGTGKKQGVKIITWNILAQTLIRRDLFPGSDSLRWGDRRAMLESELGHYGRMADILCMQECDRLPDLINSMPYDACVQAKGRGKQHGLVIAYKSERFGFRGTRVIHLDEEEISPLPEGEVDEVDEDDGRDAKKWQRGEDERRRRRGGTRQTKNVGLMVGLEDKERAGKGEGVIVITAHLFWHPKYLYERVRQFIILLRALQAFRKEHGLESWPAIMAGDFNSSPCEAPYQLLVDPSKSLQPDVRERLEESRVVHNSVDRIAPASYAPIEKPVMWSNDPAPETSSSAKPAPVAEGDQQTSTSTSANGTGANTPTALAAPVDAMTEKDDEGEAEVDPTTKTRPLQTRDGILPVDALQKIMQELVGEGLKSAYDVAQWAGKADDTFASRDGWPEGTKADKGGDEPGYTCFTGLFKLTLDYLFIIPPKTGDADVEVKQVLRPAKKTELGEGLPMKGIGASDHLAVGCEVTW